VLIKSDFGILLCEIELYVIVMHVHDDIYHLIYEDLLNSM